ncbi:MAG: zf-HC2 domain-containing protein [Chloroflexi bacterium]|nr:zf-HC2 domain-containing protein [Chloroflexota bacterium]
MRCKRVGKKLLFYLDKELTAKEQQAIQSHLSACPSCRKELESLSTTQDVLRLGAQATATKVVPWAWFELRQCLSDLKGHRSVRFDTWRSRAREFVVRNATVQLVLGGALAAALIIGALLSIRELLGPSPEALAARIAADAPEVKALLQGEPSTNDTEVVNSTGYVLSKGPTSEYTLTYVDLVKETTTKQFRLINPTLKGEDKAKATSILESDLLAQRLLRTGWVMRSAHLMPSKLELDVSDNQPRVWSNGSEAGVLLVADEQQWLARIDLLGGDVLDISRVLAPKRSWVSVDAGQSSDEIIRIARSDARVAELIDRGARVTSVSTGRGRMEGKASVLLSLGEERWIVKIDMSDRTVTSIYGVPMATWDKGYFFQPKSE